MRLATRLALTVALTVGASAFAPDVDLTPGEVATMKEVEAQVAGGDNVVVVGIGRSPGTLLYVRQRRLPGQAFQLPLTAFRYLPEDMQKLLPEDRRRLSKYQPLTDVQEKELFAHFEEFFPSEKQIGNRKIVLTDFSQRGDSLFSTKAYLDRWLKTKGRKHEIELVAITTPDRQDTVDQRSKELQMPLRKVVLEPTYFREALTDEKYDPLAEYGQWEVGSGKRPQRNPGHLDFAAALAKVEAAPKAVTAPVPVAPEARTGATAEEVIFVVSFAGGRRGLDIIEQFRADGTLHPWTPTAETAEPVILDFDRPGVREWAGGVGMRIPTGGRFTKVEGADRAKLSAAIAAKTVPADAAFSVRPSLLSVDELMERVMNSSSRKCRQQAGALAI